MTAILWIVLGAVLLGALQAGLRQLRMPETGCSWCTRVSGHTVTGHTADMCQGPRIAEQQRADIDAAHQRDLKRCAEQLTEHASRSEAEKARTDARLRIEHIGTVTTRGNEIHVTGWQFSTLPYGVKAASSQTFGHRGRPEQTCGWSVQELHAMAHGGACRCDVVRLARTLH